MKAIVSRRRKSCESIFQFSLRQECQGAKPKKQRVVHKTWKVYEKERNIIAEKSRGVMLVARMSRIFAFCPTQWTNNRNTRLKRSWLLPADGNAVNLLCLTLTNCPILLPASFVLSVVNSSFANARDNSICKTLAGTWDGLFGSLYLQIHLRTCLFGPECFLTSIISNFVTERNSQSKLIRARLWISTSSAFNKSTSMKRTCKVSQQRMLYYSLSLVNISV